MLNMAAGWGGINPGTLKMLPGDLTFDRILFPRLQAREEYRLTSAEGMAHLDTMTFMNMGRKHLSPRD